MIHETMPLLHAGLGLNEANKALVLLHGRGATAESILPLASELGADDFAVLAPQAADHVWYPQRFIAPREQNEPYLSSALVMLNGLFKQLDAAGIPAARVVLAGFSQGACLASEFVAQNPTRYGGLLVFSGGLIGTGPTVLAELYQGSLEQTPVFMGCSDVDAHIPLVRVKESSEILRLLGAEVDERIYPGMGHTINQDELEVAKMLLDQLRKD